MGLLENAAAWLDSQRQKTLSVPVVYVRRGGDVFSLNATLGRTLFRADNEYGVTIRVESRDFITSDLPTTPERGDKIIHNNRQYEVLAPNGEPVWRWSGKAMRIHTKDVGGT